MERFLPKFQIGLKQIMVFALLLITTSSIGQSVFNATSNGSAWLTANNWTPSGVPSTTGYAQFPSAAMTVSPYEVGINMNGSINNGTGQAIGGIESTGRSNPLVFGNSTTAKSGVLTFNGTTINSVANTILRNNSSSLLTIQQNTGSGTSGMTIALGNTTANIINIDGTGGITISIPISGSSKTLVKAGSGSGVLTLSASNVYTGGTTITSGTLSCGATNTLPPSGTINMNGGTLRSGASAGFAQSTGTLTLSDNSTIALGTGSHSVVFSASNGVSWTAGKMLTITGWTGTNGASGTAGKIFVGSSASGLTAGQVAQIQFTISAVNIPAVILSTGEVVPLGLTTYTSSQSGNWSDSATWGGAGTPTAADNVVIAAGHNVTLDAAATRNSGTTTTIASTGTLTLAATYTNNGTTTVNGTVQVNGGGYANGSNGFAYAATGSTLVMNHNSGLYGISTGQTFWPTTNPPYNVTIQGTGAEIVNPVGTVAGTLNVNAQLKNSVASGLTVSGTAILTTQLDNSVSGITINGTLQINGGGYVSSNAITYGGSSTLTYNTTSYTTSNNEFPSTGVKNVSITAPSGTNTVTLNGDKTITGTLAVGTHTVNGGMSITAPTITVGTGSIVANNITTSTALTCSGASAISVAGNWSVTSFTKSTSTVTFNGTGNINNATSFYNLTNASGTRSITQNIDVENTLSVTGGQMGVTGGTGKSLTMSGAASSISIAGGAIYGTDAGAGNDLSLIISGAECTLGGNASVSNNDEKKFFNITVNANKTLVLQRGILCRYGTFTVNGTLRIDANGFVESVMSSFKSPVYGGSSLLKYNVNGTYGRGAEWTAGTGTIGTTAGYPNDIQLSNNTTLDVPNTNAGAFSTALGLARDLTIDSGSSFYMDYGGNGNKSGSMTVGRDFSMAGNLSLGNASGGDMTVIRNWTRTAGTFSPNGRAVTFGGSSAQTLTGSVTFDYLTLSNSNGLTLQASSPVTVNQTLALNAGKITLGANNLTTSSTITSSSSNYVVTNSTGKLVRKSIGNTATLFPVGFSASNYTPLTLTNTTGTSDLSVSVKQSLTNAATDATKIVNLEWGVTSSAATTATVTPTWVASTPTNQAASFTNTGAGELGNYTSSYAIYPVTLATTTTTATGVSLQNGSNLIVVGNTGAVYSPPPANDLCANAIAIPNVSFPVSTTAVNNALATDSGDTGNSCQANSHKGIWYTFTPATTGNYSFSTCPAVATGGAALDNILTIFTGTCGSFTQLICNDDAGTTLCSGNTTNAVISSVALTSGVTYYIQASTYNTVSGVIQIQVNFIAPPTITTFPSSACTGSSIVINGTNLSGASAVTIGGTAATITGNTATSVTVTVGNGTTGTIAITATNGSVTSGSSITIDPTPTGTWASAATPVCASAGALTTPLAYSATTNTPTSYSITWNASPTNSFAPVVNQAHSFAGGGSGTITIDVPAGTAAGTYTGTITVSTASCTSTAVQTFTVTINPAATASASNGGPYCPGDTIQLTGGPNGMSNYSWTGPNGYTSPVISQTTSQNFDSLNAGTSWTDNATLAGWYLLQGQGTNTTSSPATPVSSLIAGAGSGTSAGVYNFNNGTNTSDRALGSLGGNSIASSGSMAFFYGVKVTNTTGATVTSATITYTGEQYRDQSSTAQTLTVDYSTNATALATASGTWTAIPALTFTSPANANAGGAIDGNSGTNRVAGITTTLTGLSIPNNSSIWIRWGDFNDSGNDQALAIDDVSVVLSAPTQNITITNATTAMSGTYTLTTTNSSGCTAQATTVVTVNLQPQGSLTANGPFCATGAGQLTWTESAGTGPYTIVYNDGVANRTASGVTSGTPFDVFTSPVTSTTTYTLVSVTDTHCSRTTAFTGNSATITVNPAHSINLSSGSSTPSVCIDTALAADIVYTVNGGANGAGVTGLPPGMSGNYNAGLFTISGTPTSSGTFNYTVTTTGNACTAATADGTITVDTAPVPGSISGDGPTCSGSNVTLSVSGQTGNIQWQSSPDNNPVNFTDIPSENGTSYTANNVTGTTYYRVVVTNGACTAASASVSVSVGGSTIWTGSWSNGAPTSSMTATISADYAEVANINACSLTIDNNAVVDIPAGFDVVLNGALTVTSGSFTLENSANLLQTTNASNSGSIIVRRNSSAIHRQDYTLWSSPVEDQNLLAFSPFTVVTPTSRFYQYNSSTNQYNGIDAPSEVTMDAAKGYLIRVANNHPTFAWVWNGKFTGVPHNGDYSYAMHNGGANFRFNLVGNPYPSPISAMAFASANNANITKTLYFWRETNNNTENNAYCSWSPAGGGNGTFVTNGQDQVVDLNGVIQTGQGFFVEAINSATQVNFTNAMRTGSNDNQFFRHSAMASPGEAESHRIWLNVTNAAGAFCQTAFGYMTDATNGYDLGIEGKYINDGSTELYSIVDDERLVIQGRALPFTPSDVVPLGFKASAAGDYTIVIDHVDGLFAQGQNVYIKDNLTGTTHDLATPYTFTSDAGIFTQRFEVVYQPALGTANPTFENMVGIIKQNGGFAISSGNVVMDNVKVFDIRGRLLLEQKGIGANATTFNVGDTNEVLIVKITSDDSRSVTRKVIN